MKKKRRENKDKSPIIPQRNKIKELLNIQERELNDKQKQFLELALDNSSKIIFISGPAGTAKTYMSVYASLMLINQRKLSDIIYVRSAVESSDSKLGFLPGQSDEKMAPYIQPLIDKLNELLPKSEINNLIKEERISSIPIGFLRGLNFNAKSIILDEAQNCTYKELITFITRIGEFSKVFILGDCNQSDINGKSGLLKMITNLDDDESKENGIYVFRLTEDDIVRSKLVKFLVKKLKC